ncbi:gp246 [Bacillus phage G]|uniref:Gp246 n=1 Tax=Bacillus phage G TaxID=2884420 RepID=G3M9Y7_9CAUD|nr:gp246 [Bacillus phage G]AEO93505.1 gp246 [Bacillus phage G]
MAKKSFFERIGVVKTEESVDHIAARLEDIDLSEYEGATSFEEEFVPTVELHGEDFLTIEQVYEKANLTDTEKSIFKVDEYSKVLPDGMTTDMKRASVIGILAASKLSIDDLIEDANERMAALQSIKVLTSENTSNIVSKNEERIVELLQEVDNLKQENNDRKSSQEKQDALLDEEITIVNGIKKFIAPESV